METPKLVCNFDFPRKVFLPPEKEDKAEPLTVDHFIFALGLFVIGIGASCLLYIGETLASVVVVSRRNRNNNDKNDAQNTLFYQRKLAMDTSLQGSVVSHG